MWPSYVSDDGIPVESSVSQFWRERGKGSSSFNRHFSLHKNAFVGVVDMLLIAMMTCNPRVADLYVGLQKCGSWVNLSIKVILHSMTTCVFSVRHGNNVNCNNNLNALLRAVFSVFHRLALDRTSTVYSGDSVVAGRHCPEGSSILHWHHTYTRLRRTLTICRLTQWQTETSSRKTLANPKRG